TEVRLEPLLQSVAELLSPRAHAAGIEIAWALDPALGYIHADEGRLRQILFNLAGNALKFTSKGGVLIEVGLTDQGLVRFSVRDTGAGIPPEARERIFEEFGQADPGRDQRYGGAGLGLVVVKKLVEAMNGTLTVDSEIGRGSIFAVEFRAPFGLGARHACPRHPNAVTLVSANDILTAGAETHLSACDIRVRRVETVADSLDSLAVVLADRATVGAPCPAPSKRSLILLAPEQRDELPAWREQGWTGYLIKPLRRASLFERIGALYDDAEDSARATHKDDERIVNESAPDKVVLLVEDNPVNALLAQILLQREGCRVERAASGEEAIAIAQARSFDLIFMDLGLPGIDGIGATKALRARGIKTPIVALTANAYEEDRRACLHAGMNDFLSKPIEIVALKARLQSWTAAAQAKAS
ncbi:MAG: response regulator, partial [Asticcacaulis sp.]